MSDDDNVVDIFSGRRRFDRQLEMLGIAVHTLQRDFAALEATLKAVHASVEALTASIHLIEDEMHKLDKALVAKISTITVAERALWIVAAAMIGVVMKLFG